MGSLSDFEIFYKAATCWGNGISPYGECAHFFYPFPALFLFLPLTAFPLKTAKIIWFIFCLVAIVATFKRLSPWMILYVPLLQAASLGQVDLILLPAILLTDGVSMVILTLKPQLVWLYLPIWFWGSSKQNRQRFIVGMVTLWGLSFILWPGWILEMLQSTRNIYQAAYASPSLFGKGLIPWEIVIFLGIAIVVISPHRWAATMVVNPAIQSYDLVVLLPHGKWWVVPLSWGIQLVSNAIGATWGYWVLSLLVAMYPETLDK